MKSGRGDRDVLPDVLAPGLDVVFCGTAAGAVARAVGAPYAGPGNRFWPTLAATGLTPRLFAPVEFHGVLEHGIGLTDLAKRAWGSDAALRRADFDGRRVSTAIEAFKPRFLAFTSKRAASEFLNVATTPYGDVGALGPTRLFVLPSPSGAARGHWDERPWFELAGLVRAARR